ncbi:hypothetical protein QCA50_005275 [Cerrena zonata]|uniref:Protein kinase domain-containing protein n=1 Tax=Cerrena zonata TaxID=2478898 RepID=A0AAW0GGI6_9APHY
MSRLLLFTGLSATALSLLGSAYYVIKLKSHKDKKRLRAKLPDGIFAWRRPTVLPTPLGEEEIWQGLEDLFRAVDLVPWISRYISETTSPNKVVSANGFSYITPIRGSKDIGPGAAVWLAFFNYMNPLTRAAETKNGQPVMVRMMAIRDQGHECVSILRKIATGPLALLSNNHCLPLFREFTFEDIVFGIFPRAGGCFEEAWGYWAKNSVGDILDMILQILEGVVFLHDHNIAHRDLFNANFLVDWHPESMLSNETAVSKPRVYIIDFEFAVEFPADCPSEERLCVGLPCTKWYADDYTRPYPPEINESIPWCPFKLDIWQLGYSFTFEGIRTSIKEIDELFSTMISDQPAERPTAKEAFTKLRQIVNCIPPKDLLVEPSFVEFE